MTPSKEDYIKAIYKLKGDTEVVSNKSLANHLDVSAASVTEMNNRLLQEGFIEYIPYQGVKLTDSGIEKANTIIRRHRLWEVFLAEKLGYNWDEVHEDADLLEHISSDRLIDKLDEFLGFPSHDPHGGPIPQTAQESRDITGDPLSSLELGQSFTIKEVTDHREILQYLTSKNIQLGGQYQIEEIEPFEGPITFKDAAGKSYLVSHQVAENILVELN